MKKSKLKAIIKECVEEIMLENNSIDENTLVEEAITEELNQELNEIEYGVQKVGDQYAIVNKKTNKVTKKTFSSQDAANNYAKAASGNLTRKINPVKSIKKKLAHVKDAPSKIKKNVKQATNKDNYL